MAWTQIPEGPDKLTEALGLIREIGKGLGTFLGNSLHGDINIQKGINQEVEFKIQQAKSARARGDTEGADQLLAQAQELQQKIPEYQREREYTPEEMRMIEQGVQPPARSSAPSGPFAPAALSGTAAPPAAVTETKHTEETINKIDLNVHPDPGVQVDAVGTLPSTARVSGVNNGVQNR